MKSVYSVCVFLCITSYLVGNLHGQKTCNKTNENLQTAFIDLASQASKSVFVAKEMKKLAQSMEARAKSCHQVLAHRAESGR